MPRPVSGSKKWSARGYEAFVKCWERGLLVRVTGDTIALSPPLIMTEAHMDEMVSILRSVLGTVS